MDSPFDSHELTDEKSERVNKLRAASKAYLATIEECVPPGRELSLTKTKLEEATFWANAGIARHH